MKNETQPKQLNSFFKKYGPSKSIQKWTKTGAKIGATIGLVNAYNIINSYMTTLHIVAAKRGSEAMGKIITNNCHWEANICSEVAKFALKQSGLSVINGVIVGGAITCAIASIYYNDKVNTFLNKHNNKWTKLGATVGGIAGTAISVVDGHEILLNTLTKTYNIVSAQCSVPNIHWVTQRANVITNNILVNSASTIGVCAIAGGIIGCTLANAYLNKHTSQASEEESMSTNTTNNHTMQQQL